MFLLDASEEKENTFWAPVNLRMPSGDGYKQQQIKMEFLELTQDDLDEHYDSGGDDEGLLLKVVHNWKHVCRAGEDGKKEEQRFDRDLLAAQLKKLWFRSACNEAYISRLTGTGQLSRKERRGKNS